jgi:FkbM family methyltransferase
MRRRTIPAAVADVLTRAILAMPADVGYRIARRVVNRRRGDNDNEFDSNGELAVVRALLPQCRVVFDVGANVGDWTAEALRINPSASYHCFEPTDAAFRRLTDRRFPSNVRLNRLAVGAASEERTMFVFGDAEGANSLYRREGLDATPTAGETIRVTTIDSYCASEGIPSIGFMKIDVEGHEVSVLEGAASMLAAGRIDLIQFEYGGAYIDAGRYLKDVWRVLAETGATYEVYKIFGGGLIPVPQYRQTWETFQYSNWLLVHRQRVQALPPQLLISAVAP